jgi:hypothetical protein
MPSFKFVLTAEVEGVSKIEPHADRTWLLKYECGRCREATPNFIELNPAEEVEVHGGTSNGMFACKFCKNQISSTIPAKGVSFFGEGGTGVVLVIDVRGGEPTAAMPEAAWTVTGAGESETPFEDADLSEDWCDYDEKEAEPVSISDVTLTGVKA